MRIFFSLFVIFVYNCATALGRLDGHVGRHVGVTNTVYSRSQEHAKKFQNEFNINKKKSNLLRIRGGGQSSDGLSLTSLKIVLQVSLSLLNVACWALPMRNKNLSQNSNILSLANCFAGGIFMMLAFGHMIPHSIEVFFSPTFMLAYFHNLHYIHFVGCVDVEFNKRRWQ